ncbi:conserved hypothetical protein [Theileria equi strain WA]|uniref:Uncharacterized protein n=1 Tax=Theileria equi strain WA TaxID=1537102 RepID=L1LD54_THEEQ|nr:conserved hypothetical protein [Theileria equi strain WA]EKX73108.1 conserved hypothetical protein [Theileria equi strain WA]|eukprot:XP_004832560.1 conserved hypothetical protein [Theileria equi strain WA]
MYNGYLYRLVVLFLALCLLIAYISIVDETSVKYNARRKILSVLPLDNLPSVVDNKTQSLNKFYSLVLQSIATWKTPVGYKVAKLCLQSGNDSYDLLTIKEKITVTLKKDVRLVVGLANDNSNIHSESTIHSRINDMNIWNVNTSTYVYVKSKNVFAISIVLLFVVVPMISVLRINNNLHEIFYRQFSDYSLLIASILLSLFNYRIIVNVIFWFIWAPILQCYVFKNYKEIIDDQQQTLRSQEHVNSINIELKDEIEGEENVTIEKKKMDYSILFLFVHIVLTFVVMGYSRDSGADTATKSIYKSVKCPFNVPSAPTYMLGELHRKNDTFSIDIEHKNMEAQINELYEISSTSALSPWVDSIVKSVNANKTTILVKGNKGAKYQIYKEQTIDDLKQVLFIFQGDTYFTVMEADFTQENCDYKNVDMLSFKLGWSIGLRIFTILDCFTLLACLILHRKTQKTKLRIGLIVSSLAVNIGLILVLVILIPMKLSSIHKATESEVISSVGPIFQFMTLRNWMTFFLFLNLIFLLGYISISVPRSYLTFNINMTAIKRPININIANLLIISYQGLILMLMAACIGTSTFGSNLPMYKNYFSALKYLLLMTFNKLYLDQKNIALWIYYRICIVVFYIIMLTAIIATFYFGSQTKDLPENKNFETFTDQDYNINVDIKATREELMYFKVFLKALESYREHNKGNPEHVDSIEKFMETFTQSQTGLHRLKFNTTQHVYLERLKRYLICIIFLRIKIHYSENKVEELETYSKTLHLNSERRKNYLMLLENKIESTMKELQRFKDSNEIIETIKKAKEVSQEEKSKNEEPRETKYNLEDLESFITNPNVSRQVDEIEQVNQEETPVGVHPKLQLNTSNSQDLAPPEVTLHEQIESSNVTEVNEVRHTIPAECTNQTEKSSEETGRESTENSGSSGHIRRKNSIKENKKRKNSKNMGIFKTSILK